MCNQTGLIDTSSGPKKVNSHGRSRALFFSFFFSKTGRTEGQKNHPKKIAVKKKMKNRTMQKNSSGGKKGEIRRSKKLKELPCTLLQSTDFLENWARILSDLELQDRAQTELIRASWYACLFASEPRNDCPLTKSFSATVFHAAFSASLRAAQRTPISRRRCP